MTEEGVKILFLFLAKNWDDYITVLIQSVCFSLGSVPTSFTLFGVFREIQTHDCMIVRQQR